jgi:hypothetical protein
MEGATPTIKGAIPATVDNNSKNFMYKACNSCCNSSEYLKYSSGYFEYSGELFRNSGEYLNNSGELNSNSGERRE